MIFDFHVEDVSASVILLNEYDSYVLGHKWIPIMKKKQSVISLVLLIGFDCYYQSVKSNMSWQYFVLDTDIFCTYQWYNDAMANIVGLTRPWIFET